MQLQFKGRAYPDIRGWVGIEFWTSDEMPRKFIVRVANTYARNRGWDCSAGLMAAVDEHVSDVRFAAQLAFNEGALELMLIA